jgi:peptide methionine sulfoxide reductase MsrA
VPKFGMIARLQPEYRDLIVTQVEKLGEFYPAEDYHMNYYNENSSAPYCSLIISPKLGKLREKYGEKMKDIG